LILHFGKPLWLQYGSAKTEARELVENAAPMGHLLKPKLEQSGGQMQKVFGRLK
jgi:hypothetical protein